jgi:hypothetical protein
MMPVARKVWQLIFVWMPASAARRLIMRYTSGCLGYAIQRLQHLLHDYLL